MVKTLRPITNFENVIFGNANTSTSSVAVNYRIKSSNPIELNVELNVREDAEELSIEADQNLQKFFIVESDGLNLKIYLDSYDDNGVRTIYYSNDQNASTVLDKHSTNYIRSVSAIKINLRTSKSFVRINKFDFNVVNVRARLQYKFYNAQPTHNSFSKFSCNGNVIFNNVFLDEPHDDKFELSSQRQYENIFVHYCNELYQIYLQETDDTCILQAIHN